MTFMRKSFASDNRSGAHPRILEAVAAANVGHTPSYGADPWSERAAKAVARALGGDPRVFFVFLGTAANVLCLKTMARSYEAVISSGVAHLNTDECGAPEQFVGCKVLSVPSGDGRITPEAIEPLLHLKDEVHHSRPRVVSITQSTEMGCTYRPEEIRALADFCHGHGLYLHMDGARLANAAAFLGTDLKALTSEAGVDALSFGGTKNGLLYGEAVVLFRPELAADFPWMRKQGMQLASKMRFIAAQFEAYLEDDLWLATASHANAMARLLAREVAGIPGVEVVRPVEANGVFATCPMDIVPALQAEYPFYVWDRERSEMRWMASFDTTEEDVRGFVAALRRLIRAGSPS